ncbi:hypothetical protein Adt_03990 [Abeliophyllum distichum]|uniref:Uncharacterized protein n=1 Tax=Abeliophyllum distichum TaxID=126358 RepID=A0ABD1W019_9LAMI
MASFHLSYCLILCEENKGSWEREGNGAFTASFGTVPKIRDNGDKIVFPMSSPSSSLLKNAILEKAYLAINRSVRWNSFLQWGGQLSSGKIYKNGNEWFIGYVRVAYDPSH